MAERRMLTKKVTDDDNFLSLSASAQALYLHLSMSADDDGFCNQVNLAMFKAHASVGDLQNLLEKRYLYQFENGVIVIKHWRMANALRKDRYTPTAFQEELKHLKIKDNGVYTFSATDGCQVVANCLPQERIGEDSTGKSNIYSPEIKEIIDYLNAILGTKYTYRCESNNKHIRARLSEGHTVEEFKRVIDIKYKTWCSDSKMSKYLRPETLFGNKFEGYLNEGVANGNKRNDVKYDAREVWGDLLDQPDDGNDMPFM